jgi:hypothetical protein
MTSNASDDTECHANFLMGNADLATAILRIDIALVPHRSGACEASVCQAVVDVPLLNVANAPANSNRARPPPDQQCANHRHCAEPQERPVGNGSTQEGPIDLGAITTALENHGNGALQREGLDHAVKVAPAGHHFRRVPL